MQWGVEGKQQVLKDGIKCKASNSKNVNEDDRFLKMPTEYNCWDVLNITTKMNIANQCIIRINSPDRDLDNRLLLYFLGFVACRHPKSFFWIRNIWSNILIYARSIKFLLWTNSVHSSISAFFPDISATGP